MIKINNLTYIYFTDSNILESINKLIYNKIGIYIIKYDLKIKSKYIVCKNNNNNIIINSNNININISKIIKTYERYVTLIYII